MKSAVANFEAVFLFITHLIIGFFQNFLTQMQCTKRKNGGRHFDYNHTHKYGTRSKRHCSCCPSSEGSAAGKELLAQNNGLVACSNDATEQKDATMEFGTGLENSTENPGLVACHNSPRKRKTDIYQSSSKSATVSWIPRKHLAQDTEFVPCKSIEKGYDFSPSLPNDALFDILLLFSAEVLYDNMRFVCKGWHDTINDPTFISKHLQMPSCIPSGVIVQDHRDDHDLAHYFETNDDHNNSDQCKVAQYNLPLLNKLVGSYHGLALLHDWMKPQVFNVVNLVTKMKVSLPPSPGLSYSRGQFSALSYASSVGLYKVVYIVGDAEMDVPEVPEIVVCSVGVDTSWRKINLEGISMKSLRSALRSFPFSIHGFIYWLHPVFRVGYALDVDTETLYEFPRPDTYEYKYGTCGHCMNLDTTLGFFNWGSQTDVLEFYELTDMKSGKWTKVLEIKRKELHTRVVQVFPHASHFVKAFAYLKNGDFWFSYVIDKELALVCYNVKKEKVSTCPLAMLPTRYRPSPHASTLVNLKNC